MILLNFSVENYDKMSKELKSKLRTTSIDLFHMINKFAKVHNIKKEVALYLLDDDCRTQIQIQVKGPQNVVGPQNIRF